MARWTIQAGRGLVRDGVHVGNLTWPIATGPEHRAIELDALALRIVALLNAAEPGGVERCKGTHAKAEWRGKWLCSLCGAPVNGPNGEYP